MVDRKKEGRPKALSTSDISLEFTLLLCSNPCTFSSSSVGSELLSSAVASFESDTSKEVRAPSSSLRFTLLDFLFPDCGEEEETRVPLKAKIVIVTIERSKAAKIKKMSLHPRDM